MSKKIHRETIQKHLRSSTKRLLLPLMFLLINWISWTEEPYVPGTEAPASLFDAKIGDADVSLKAEGSWDLFLTGSIGYKFSGNGEKAEKYTFPGFEQTVPFKQVPNLSLSLLLMNRYFFETSIISNPENDYTPMLDTYLFGYNGQEGEFLQSVRIGNTQVNMGDYSLVSVPEAPKESLGASARFTSGSSEHEVLLRYEPAEQQKKSYLGSSELIEEFIEPMEYVKGTYFILPDADVEQLEILIEDPEGLFSGSDGRYYRAVVPEDLVSSPLRGTVSLKRKVRSRILVYYTKGGIPVGSTSLGRDALSGVDTGDPGDPDDDLIDPEAELEHFSFGELFSWGTGTYMGRKVSDLDISVGNRTFLLLHDPGFFSPFEHAGYYALSRSPRENRDIRVTIAAKGGRDQYVLDISSQLVPGKAVVALVANDDDSRDPRNRYPLASMYPALYGPRGYTQPGEADAWVQVTMTIPSESYTLEDRVIEGSETVLVNGSKTTLYTIDYATGMLQFYMYIHPNDRVDIFYSTSSEIRGGNLLFGQGNRFTISPALSAEIGSLVDWDVLGGTYTTSLWERPGRVLVSGGLDYAGDNFSVAVDAGVSITTPDTTGVYRALGLDESIYTLSMYQGSVFPASPPEIPLSGRQLEPGNRGTLYFRDYHNYSVLGSGVLMPYTWTEIPESQTADLSSGEPAGPYTVRAAPGETITGEVLAMDFSMSNTSFWVGSQVPLNLYDESPDLTSCTALSFSWKTEGEEQAFEDLEFYLKIGSLGEDLDSDGTLDRETSATSQGFPFDDAASGKTLLIGGGPRGEGNGVLDSEDLNGNGVLDRDIDALLVTAGPYSLPVPRESWKTAVVQFTENERRRLTNTESVRILIVNNGSGDAQGKLLISGISFTGTDFSVDPVEAGSVTARQVSNEEALHPPGTDSALNLLYPETASLFHSEGDEGKQLEINWNGISPTRASVSGYIDPLPVEHYRYLNFYIRTPVLSDPGSTEFKLSVLGSDGNGLRLSFPLAEYEEWQKITVNIPSATVLLSDREIGGAELTITETAGILSGFRISVTGSESGSLYFDELYLEESVISAGVTLESSLEYVYPFPLLFIREIPVFGNLSMKQDLSISSPHYENGSFDSFPGLDMASNLGFDLFFTGFDLRFGMIWNYEEIFLSGGHTMTFPSGGSGVVFIDSYGENNTFRGRSITRSNSLIVSPFSWFQFRFDQQAGYTFPLLTQSWKIAGALLFPSLFSLRSVGELSIGSSGYTPEQEFYTFNWIRAYSLTLPRYNDTSADRGGSGSLQAAILTIPVGVTLDISGEFTVAGTADRTQDNRGAGTLLFPVTLGTIPGRTWEITPGYERTYSTLSYGADQLLLRDDIKRFFSDFSKQRYLYASIPFVELFSRTTPEMFTSSIPDTSEALYNPSFSIDLSRPYGSNIYDLFLPAQVNFTVGRFLEKEEEWLYDKQTYTTTIRATALNLFGRLGRYSCTEIYETEEINTSVTIDIEHDNKESRLAVKTIVQNLLIFEGKDDTQLSLENRFSRNKGSQNSFSEEAWTSYTWRRPGLAWTPKMLSRLIESSPYFNHTEHIDLKVTGTDNPESITGVEIIAGHRSRLIFPNLGDVQAHISAGIDRTGANEVILGFQGGLEAHFSF